MNTNVSTKHLAPWAILVIFCLSTSILSAEDFPRFQFGPFSYCVVEGTVTITDFPDGFVGEVVIPAEIDGRPVTRIHWRAFRSCDALTSVTIPASVSDIGPYAFIGCSALTSILVEPGNLHYASAEGVLFDAAMTWLIEIPEGKAGAYTIPEGVVDIGWGRGFWRCRALTSITIPSSVTDLEEGVDEVDLFEGCSALTAILVAPGNPNYTSDEGVLFGPYGLIRCPQGKQGHYTIPEGVGRLCYEAFADCTQLTGITLPESLGDLGVSTFYGCSRLESVYFLGNRPYFWWGSMVDGADAVTVYCFDEAEGFGSSYLGRPLIRMGPSAPITKWILRKELPYDIDVLSDLNADGVPLLMAYALNLDPARIDFRDMPRTQRVADQLLYTFYAGSDGIIYAVETSTDMQTWTTAGVVLSDPDANGFRTASLPMTGSCAFLRLVVSE